mmetsp:Transcript_20448/g.33878  ORF Transcript_20448/g.33878 Transcript_20448/m.33878 type:complete len:155 (-) Transcript_20448:135-599(-)
MRTFLLLSLSVATVAFQPLSFTRRSSTQLHDATGGWGSTNSRNMSELEKAGGKRRSFDKYDAQEQGQFLRQVKEDRKAMLDLEKAELLSVAEFAGLSFNDPTDDKYSVDLFMDEEDDLDVSVQFQFDAPADVEASGEDSSITRMDEDTGVPGNW